MESPSTKKSKIKTALKAVGIVLALLFADLLFFGFFSVLWVMRSFPYVSVPEAISTIMSLSGTPTSSIMPFIYSAVIPSVVVAVVIAITYLLLFLFKVKWRNLICILTFTLSGLVAAVPSLAAFWNYLDLTTYIKAMMTESSFVDEHYVDPASIELEAPAKPRNLIFLFLESMETTYADAENGGYFDYNYIPELTELAETYDDFSGDSSVLNGSHCLEYTSWTMAAMFAHTSGLPFKTILGQNNMDTQETFFPNVMALGDVLANDGYDQTFFCGSDATFGGRRLYLSEHGGFAFRDYVYYHGLPSSDPDHVNHDGWWGYEDFRLFDFLKETILEKQEAALAGNPFNITGLTVDTHFNTNVKDDDGHPCYLCDQQMVQEDRYGAVISCSSRQISQFVDWFYSSGEVNKEVSDNTTMVLVGDHVSMTPRWLKEADSDNFDRRTYYCFINSAVEVAPEKTDLTREYCAFDTYPTTLAALGYSIPGDRLGLGTNLYSATPTLIEQFGVDTVNTEIQNRSDTLESLLEVDEFNMTYLARKGWLPTATPTIEVKESDIHAVLADIGKPVELREGFAGATVTISAIGGEEKTFDLQLLGDNWNYGADILIAELPEAKAWGYKAEFHLLGENSGNAYSFDIVEFDLD